MADPICQKIIVNMDTDFTIGRLCAQAAHASWLAVLNNGKWIEDNLIIECTTSEMKHWLQDQFTKVILRGSNDLELIKLRDKSESLGLPVGLMIEDGYITALAIGPSDTKVLDKITRGLDLL